MQAIKNPTPIQNPKTFGEWSVGQTVQIAELAGKWLITSINIFDFQAPHEFDQINLNKLKRDGTQAKYSATVRAEKLITLDGKQPTMDKAGRTAAEAAQVIFISGFAKHDYYNTTRESLVKVDSITKTGRIKVQDISVKKGLTTRSKMVDGHKIYSQEDQLINFASLEYELRGDPKTFSPSLHDGKWTWWKGGEVIEAPNMRLTWLLD